MRGYRVVAIPEDLARQVRETGRSPRYGHPVHADVAKGYGPCRLCLGFFRKGEERRVLFTHDAFEGAEALPLPGPVYIHESPCPRYPEQDGFPEHLGQHALTLAAFGRGRRLRAEEYVDDGLVEPAIERLLARPDVDYIQVHDTAAGCYDLRLERA
jgi:Protein of unknown function (DUF1203)